MQTTANLTTLTIGDKWTKTHRFPQAEFDAFAAVSGDDNPIHVDPEFSARTRFGKTVSHGMLLYSVLWGMIQTTFPGAQQVSQEIKFPAPTFTDEDVLFEIEITAIDDQGNIHLITRASTPMRETIGLEGSSVIAVKGE